jgi:hypothetical protein
MTTDSSPTTPESNSELSPEETETTSQRAENGERPLSTADLVQRADEHGDDSADSGEGTGARDGGQEPDVTDPPLVTDADAYLARWQTIQVAFVDEPKGAVQDADSLVAEVMQRLAESFASERDRLEQQWSGGEETGTEELRLALQRYRSFFNRLLKT